MSRDIRKLPDTLINQIAAGEIVERPASAVKELVENSIDAQARQITVSIREGGRAALVVSDDGYGIPCDQLILAVDRHATSKLSDSNLSSIATLGFRGEALPSLAAVSRLTITSRVEESDSGWSLVVDCGRKGEVIPAAHPIGTRVEVMDLFHNVPARLKFLKSVRTETDQIREIMLRLALITPHIAFTLKTEKKHLLTTTATDQETRIKQLLGDTFLENAKPVDLQRDDFSLGGYISIPTFNRNTTQYLYLYVNQRPVRDKLLYNAIKVAYGDLLPRDRFPMVVLFLDVPYEWVDVNVHPTKAEVRFRDSHFVKDMVIVALQQALTTVGHQTATVHSTATLTAMQKNREGVVSARVSRATLLYNAPPSFSKSTLPLPSSLTQQGDAVQKQPSSWDHVQSTPTHTSSTTPTLHTTPTPHTTTHTQTTTDSNGEEEQELPPLIEEETGEFPLGYAQAQIHKTYIVTQTKEGMVLVDQHAAHERILYERFKAVIGEGHLDVKRFLIPVVVSLEESLQGYLLDYGDVLRRLGIEVEEFGVGCVIIHTVPYLLESVNMETFIVDVADQLREYGDTSVVQTKLENVCSSLACHGAIRSGQVLSIAEMNTLLRKIEHTPNSAQCNHGRPTSISLKLSDIERLFERR